MIEKIRQWFFNLCYRPMTEEEERKEREILVQIFKAWKKAYNKTTLQSASEWLHRNCIPRSRKGREFLQAYCTSCGSQMIREDVYYDTCGVCSLLPMSREIKAASEVLLECDTCGYCVKGTAGGIGNECGQLMDVPSEKRRGFSSLSECHGRVRLAENE